MSSKFFDKMDHLPIVRALQIAAALIFVLGVTTMIMTIIFQYSAVIESSKTGEIWFLFLGMINAILGSLFSPLVLLALAEIIKQRKPLQ